MATASYIFNAYSSAGALWHQPENSCDGSDGTNAYIGSAGVETGTIYQSANACDGASLGKISKVEIRILYNKAASGQTCQLIPEFGGSDLGDAHALPDQGAGSQWCDWVDITSDTNAPDWASDWNHIKNLDQNIYAATVGGSAVYVYGSEVRVTYDAPVQGDISVEMGANF